MNRKPTQHRWCSNHQCHRSCPRSPGRRAAYIFQLPVPDPESWGECERRINHDETWLHRHSERVARDQAQRVADGKHDRVFARSEKTMPWRRLYIRSRSVAEIPMVVQSLIFRITRTLTVKLD